ncbi:MAG TPA: ATP-binding protein [Fibrobacteria bacterium]|nr:ATP-binding protein [Fibrobacteria bacterium]
MNWTGNISPLIYGLLIVLIATTCLILWIRVRLLERIHADLSHAQSRHREAEHRLSLILDAASDQMVLLRLEPSDGVLRFVAGNRAFALEAFPDGDLSDLGDLLDRKFDDVASLLSLKSQSRMMHRSDQLEAAVRSGQPVVWDDEWDSPEGRVLHERSDIPILEGDVCTHVLRVAHDVTGRWRDQEERAALEKKAFQSQKMEAIGTLAGGVAHDFNNILGAVVGKTNVAISRLAPDHCAREPLDDILAACKRAKALVRQLLDFGRPDPGRRLHVDLSTVVREVVRLLRSAASARVRFVVEAPDHGIAVEADPSRLQQVVLNLVTNAVQAIGARAGTVKIRLETNSTPEQGRIVVLSVEDDGCGMPPETMQRIFEPFFSTKEKGQGSGWGLAVAHAAIREMGGSIGVRSSEGEGTVFTVELPAVEMDPGPGPADSGVFDRNCLPRSAAQVRLLLVDDEPLILSAYAELLETMGCQVVRAQSPLKAVEILENREEAIDLLITDVSMPQMSGLELVRKARESRRGIPIILLSGNMGREEREEAESLGVGVCLAKPVDITELRNAIDHLVGRPTVVANQEQLALPGL